MDYTGNSKKDKADKKPEKEVKKVITGSVVLQKKSLGQKFKETFIADSFKSVGRYIIYDICIPAFQNMLVDSVSKGIERMTYGERSRRPGLSLGTPRYQYNSPIRRGYGAVDNLDRRGLPMNSGYSGPGISNRSRASMNNEIILTTREDALLVLERMTDICDQYQVVTVGDLNSLIDQPSTHVDEKWGWEDVRDIQVRAVREGFLLDLPQPQPLQ